MNAIEAPGNGEEEDGALDEPDEEQVEPEEAGTSALDRPTKGTP